MLKASNIFILIFFICAIPFLGFSQAKKVDSLENIVSNPKEDFATAQAYRFLIDEYARTNQLKAKQYAHRCLQLSKSINNGNLISASTSYLVTINQDMGLLDSAAYFFALYKGFAETYQGSDRNKIIASFNQTAGLYYKNLGDPLKAVSYQENAVKYSKLAGDKTHTAGMYLNLGNTYSLLAKHSLALSNRLDALKLFEELGNERGQSFCLNGIGFTLLHMKQYSKALAYAARSLKLKEKLDDKRGVQSANNLLGEIYTALKNFDKAKKYYEESLRLAVELKLPRSSAETYFNLGNFYKQFNMDSLSIQNFEKSKEFSLQVKDTTLFVSANREIASIQSGIKVEARQESLIKEGLDQSLKKGKLQEQLKSYEQLYTFYKSKNEPAKAIEYLEKFHQLKDSIGGIDQQVALAKMEEEYNRSKNEKEIQLLQKDKEIAASKLKQQKTTQAGIAALFVLAALSAWLLFSRYRIEQKVRQQREMENVRSHIARDLHDEVGSSLSSISMLSAMAKEQIKDPSLSITLLERVKTNATETMERMSDIVWMIKPGADEGGQLKERMQRILNELSNDHGIKVEANLLATESLKMNMEIRKNIYLIFKEAVNNALKYSGMKLLKVDMTQSGNMLQLIVVDNGRGFDINAVQKGNGLDNMLDRAKGMGGKLNIRPAKPGTVVELLVPVEG